MDHVPQDKNEGRVVSKNKHEVSSSLTYSLIYLLTYLVTYLLTYLLHGAESFLRS